MAITNTTIWEVRTTGADTNGGGFDTGATANAITNASATSANTANPVLSTASYTFTAGDVGAWVYVAAGTNWTQGWYQIASVNAGAATLSAAAGAALLAPTFDPSTAAGCATVASPTNGTILIDYSQQAAAVLSLTDLACVSATTTLTSATGGFTRAMVGNYVRVNSGTNALAGFYRITAYTNTNTVTIDRTCATGGNMSAGVGSVGGALASPGMASGAMGSVTGQDVFVLAGTYTITSSTANVSNGRVVPANGGASGTNPQRWIGYASRRNDNPTGSSRPTITVSGVTSQRLVDFGSNSNIYCANLVVDGADQTGITGIYGMSSLLAVVNCRTTRCLQGGVHLGGGAALGCECDDCGDGAGYGGAFVVGLGSSFGFAINCYSHDHNNNISGFSGSNGYGIFVYCVADTIVGTGTGFNAARLTVHCTNYNSGASAFTQSSATGIAANVNDLAVSATYGFNPASSGIFNLTAGIAGQGCTSGAWNAAYHYASAFGGAYSPLTPSGDPLADGAGGDFDLDSTLGEGAALTGTAYPQSLPGAANTTPKPSVGYSQPAASGGGLLTHPGMAGGMRG